ncbi:MAG: hypothetical protein VW378_06995 [bacterium]
MTIHNEKKEKQLKLRQLRAYIQKIDGRLLCYQRLLTRLQTPYSEKDKQLIETQLSTQSFSSMYKESA